MRKVLLLIAGGFCLSLVVFLIWVLAERATMKDELESVRTDLAQTKTELLLLRKQMREAAVTTATIATLREELERARNQSSETQSRLSQATLEKTRMADADARLKKHSLLDESYKTIAGDVFVRTKGGNTIKIGGAKIYLCTKEKYQEGSKAVMEMLSTVQRLKPESVNLDTEAGLKVQNLVLRAAQISAWAAFLGQDSNIRSTILTDSDGRFSITLGDSIDDLFLICVAERDVLGQRELYFWAHDLGALTGTERISLFDGNMTQSYSLGELFEDGP